MTEKHVDWRVLQDNDDSIEKCNYCKKLFLIEDVKKNSKDHNYICPLCNHDYTSTKTKVTRKGKLK